MCLNHPCTLFATNLHSGTSSVLYNPSSKAIKDIRVLDTLILFIEGYLLKLRFFGTFLNHLYTFLAIKLQSGTSSVLYNPSSKAKKDMMVLDTLLFIRDTWNLNTSYIRILFSYPCAFLAMKPHPWTSSVLYNPKNEDKKERKILWHPYIHPISEPSMLFISNKI